MALVLLLLAISVTQSVATIKCFSCNFDSYHRQTSQPTCSDPSTLHNTGLTDCNTGTCYYMTAGYGVYRYYERGCWDDAKPCEEQVISTVYPYKLYRQCCTTSYCNKGETQGQSRDCYSCDYSECNDTESCMDPDSANTVAMPCNGGCTTTVSNTTGKPILSRGCSDQCPADSIQCCITQLCNNKCGGTFCPMTTTTATTTAITTTTTTNTTTTTMTTSTISITTATPSTAILTSAQTQETSNLTPTNPGPDAFGQGTEGPNKITCYDCLYKRNGLAIDHETCKHPDSTTKTVRCPGWCRATIDSGIISESYERRCSVECADSVMNSTSVGCCQTDYCNGYNNYRKGAALTWFLPLATALRFVLRLPSGLGFIWTE